MCAALPGVVFCSCFWVSRSVSGQDFYCGITPPLSWTTQFSRCLCDCVIGLRLFSTQCSNMLLPLIVLFPTPLPDIPLWTAAISLFFFWWCTTILKQFFIFLIVKKEIGLHIMQTDCLFWYFRLGLCYTAKNHKHLNCTRDLVGTQATRTNINRFRRAVHNRFNPTNIGFPSTVGFSVGMGHVIAENNAFSAYTAFCHGGHLLL